MIDFKKLPIASAMIFLLCFYSIISPSLSLDAQITTISEDMVQAQIDARNHVGSGLNAWYFGGCFLGIFGIAGSVLITPDVPPINLLGKTPEYVIVYTHEYKSKSKSVNLKSSLAGFGTTLFVYAFLFLATQTSPH